VSHQSLITQSALEARVLADTSTGLFEDEVYLITLDFNRIYNQLALDKEMEKESVQDRVLQVKDVGFYDLLKDDLIVHLENKFDRNTLSHVKVYEPYFKTLRDVLRENKHSGGLQQLGSQYLQVGDEWYMQIERNELALEVMQLIRIHERFFGKLPDNRPLCPDQMGFVVQKPSEDKKKSICLKILPFKVDSSKKRPNPISEYEDDIEEEQEEEDGGFYHLNPFNQDLDPHQSEIAGMMKNYLGHFENGNQTLESHQDFQEFLERMTPEQKKLIQTI
jgi:hypothetical protein